MPRKASNALNNGALRFPALNVALAGKSLAIVCCKITSDCGCLVHSEKHEESSFPLSKTNLFQRHSVLTKLGFL